MGAAQLYGDRSGCWSPTSSTQPILAQVLPVKPHGAPRSPWRLNLTIIAGYVLLAYADSLRRRPVSRRREGLVSDAAARAGIPRDGVVRAGPAQLRAGANLGSVGQVLSERAGREGLSSNRSGRCCPRVLEISYPLVYAIPYFSLGVLYAYGHRERADRFLFPFALAVLSAYALFPYFPSEPPRTVFPGEDFPAWTTIFRRFNWGMLGAYGIHTSVFPSAHVFGSFLGGFRHAAGAAGEEVGRGRFLLVHGHADRHGHSVRQVSLSGGRGGRAGDCSLLRWPEWLVERLAGVRSWRVGGLGSAAGSVASLRASASPLAVVLPVFGAALLFCAPFA